MDNPEIRKETLLEFGGKERDVRVATNKLSDTLGFMWRRGLLTRYPAPRGELSFARFAYSWASNSKDEPAGPISPPIRSTKGFPEDNMLVLIEVAKRLTEAIQDVAKAIREKK